MPSNFQEPVMNFDPMEPETTSFSRDGIHTIFHFKGLVCSNGNIYGPTCCEQSEVYINMYYSLILQKSSCPDSCGWCNGYLANEEMIFCPTLGSDQVLAINPLRELFFTLKQILGLYLEELGGTIFVLFFSANDWIRPRVHHHASQEKQQAQNQPISHQRGDMNPILVFCRKGWGVHKI